MNYTETLDLNRIEEFETLRESKSVYLFTNLEARPRTDCNWFYRALVAEGESSDLYPVDEGAGSLIICNCSDCSSLGKDLLEYYSVFQALSWAEIHSPHCQIQLWITSDKIISQWNNQELWALALTHCPFLKALGNGLQSLTSELKVEIIQYGYANKEIIPYTFEGR